MRSLFLVVLILISPSSWSAKRGESSLMVSAAVPRDVILIGDSVAEMNKLPPASVDLVFADPPYNLQLEGSVSRPDCQTLIARVDDEWDRFSNFGEYDAFTRA